MQNTSIRSRIEQCNETDIKNLNCYPRCLFRINGCDFRDLSGFRGDFTNRPDAQVGIY